MKPSQVRFDSTLVDVTGGITYTVELVAVEVSGTCEYFTTTFSALLLPGM